MLCTSTSRPPMPALNQSKSQTLDRVDHARGTKRRFQDTQGDAEQQNLTHHHVGYALREKAHSTSRTTDGLALKAPSYEQHSVLEMKFLDAQMSPVLDPILFDDSWSCSTIHPRSCRDSQVLAQRPSDGITCLDHNALDSHVSTIGSWCEGEQEPIDVAPSELFKDMEQETLGDGWCPPTPREQRLPTPDLPPLSTDFEFCSCCPDEDAKINELWYLTSKAKTDDLMKRAITYIAEVRNRAEW